MGEPTAKILEGRAAAPPRSTGSIDPVVEAGGASREDRRTESRHTLVGWARKPRRPRLWFEIALIGASYWVYSLVRNAVPKQAAAAMRHAHQIWHLEQSLGIAVENRINHAIDSVTWLIVGMNYYYATLHFIMTIGVLVWLYRKHPGRYASARLTIFATTGIALVGFYFYPLAPPRLMAGGNFIDTVAVHHTWGSMASGDLAHVSNQYAAMPSMHIGWSLWCGITIATLARPLWARALGILYPVTTLVVIISTANHFWLDAGGGIVTLSFGFTVSFLVYGRLTYRLPRYVALATAAH
ncbi:phosphatase PAP2 family protein [Streptomyces sp. RB6PN25]|uniref:Phosphatase PAP2 family protein n=1 Tax=Streptomyces humicola TaxID=2953240 RepID=A0ABT1PVD6_9ACTN|nr:phosphatase PAP2 family protein [Streptomyces humicola]MCQ4081632.1 phosphatase PAP2 family protein [Streptomyces humicola]